MTYLFKTLFIITSFFLFFASCSKDEKPIPPGGEEDDVNTWIHKTMDKNYLWSIPDKSSLDFSQNPDKFFASLLSRNDGIEINGTHQYFSYIEEKETTRAIDENNPTYGFDFGAYRVINDNQETIGYYAIILYVLPNSPAAEAGLKRGDLITAVENNPITNFDLLRTGSAAKFDLMKFDSDVHGFVDNGSVTISAARIVENNPILKDSIYSIGKRTIGYLHYTRFMSGPGGYKDVTYNNQMKDIFKRFKQKGVNEFVLDLRYNGGGLVSCAQLLSSLLAPTDALGRTFCYMIDKNKRKSEYFFLKEKEVADMNLNLSRLYVITGEYTASASEAIINTLYPYMDGGKNPHNRTKIKVIGEQTIGKNVGSNTYGENENYGWLMHPITFWITNRDSFYDYGDGFTPDTQMDELVEAKSNPMYELGDTREALLNEAIRQMTGISMRSEPTVYPSTTQHYEVVYKSLSEKRNGELINDLIE
ncbi:S41 family peptidase [Parabacteroides sp. PF5-9]|uniref:S41 family peptidase n=1 Tax=Parabacteroides sp. PF5-9 TaxID=1742404 RepID=UPI002474C2C9|nr:S41 family peptidase [Parabacteroides sp. PF5-9]MDH6356416.1 carboxyl-terminal processing protease [Parabacteroides sp. PF5-9]